MRFNGDFNSEYFVRSTAYWDRHTTPGKAP
jgi:hypothetical protein